LLVNAMTRSARRPHGFSLLELMITITVVAILLAIAVPSFRDVIRRNQVSSASNELLASIAYARTEAIDRGQLVSICPSADGAACTASGQAYEPGWIIYTYPAGAASANKAYAAASSTLLRAIGARAGVSIQSGGTTNSVITFGQQGQLRPSTALTFVTCARTGTSGTGESTTAAPGVGLTVNGSGSASSQKWAVGAACAF
jgi:type IV fimbrial biogenesis protein FimT